MLRDLSSDQPVTGQAERFHGFEVPGLGRELDGLDSIGTRHAECPQIALERVCEAGHLASIRRGQSCRQFDGQLLGFREEGVDDFSQ